jgi:hypothetical protein
MSFSAASAYVVPRAPDAPPSLVRQADSNLAQVVSFIVGFATENVYYALYVGLAGLVVTLLAVVPPWPFYNRDPVQWLPASRGAWIGTGQSKKTN